MLTSVSARVRKGRESLGGLATLSFSDSGQAHVPIRVPVHVTVPVIVLIVSHKRLQIPDDLGV